jgi:hypothetical protein
MSKTKKQNDKDVADGAIELDDDGKVITDSVVLESRRADEIEAAFAAKAEKTGGVVSYAEVMATGIPVSAMLERGWENVTDRAGIRKVKHGTAAISDE